jgi:UDP-N-acetylmuramoyl-tripeptide--D-alanyl-D-alanine ligase
MARLTLAEIARLTEGQLLQGSPSALAEHFSFDSRTIERGGFFFALSGTRDGHEFVAEVASKGAVGACVAREIKGLPESFGLIKVADTLKALQKLASRILENHKLKVIGITGSTGKTTTKEFTAALLATRYRVLKTVGNFNNQIGLPYSILAAEDFHQVAVLEMGMSRPGEIRELTQIAPPDLAIITGIAPVHLEFFKNLEEIALAKKEILDGAREGATAVLNGDDPLLKKIAADYKKGEIIYFGLNPSCQVRAENIRHLGLEGIAFNLIYGPEKAPIKVSFLHEGLVYNLLAACAACLAMQLKLEEIVPVITQLSPAEHRGQIIRLKNEITLFDDSYNSNPVALKKTLESLSRLKARRKIAVLGDMLELGPAEIEFHLEAGKQVALTGWDYLVTVGERAKHLASGAVANGFNRANISSFLTAEEAAQWLKDFILPGDFILIKASHGLALDKIVKLLRQELEE